MKPRLLFLCGRSPLPATDGTKEHIRSALAALAPHWRIDLVIISREKVNHETEDDLRKLSGGAVSIFYLPGWLGAIKSAWGILAKPPLQSAFFYLKRVQKKIDETSHNYQAFYCHTLRLAPYFIKAQEPGIAKRVFLDFNDAISLNYSIASSEVKGVWRLLYGIEKKRLIRYETLLLDYFSHYSLLTRRDHGWMLENWKKSHPEKIEPELKVIRYGMDDKILSYDYSPRTNNLVFIGNLEYAPNLQGLKKFCDLVWPQIRAIDPKRELLIIGRGGEKFGREKSGIRPLGFIADPHRLMSEQSALINPVTFGAGISTKSLLALGIGLPLISAPTGLAGIEGAEGLDNVLMIDYDHPAETAKNIISFIADSAARIANSPKEKELASSLYLRSKNDELLIRSLEVLARPDEGRH